MKKFTLASVLVFVLGTFVVNAQQNLIPNNSFETSASTYTYWGALNGSSNLSISAANAYSGTKSLSISPATTTANYNIQLATAVFATNNTSITYTVTAYGMVPSTEARPGNIQFELRDMLTGGTTSYSGNMAVPKTGVWTKLTWVLPAGKPSSSMSRIVLDLGAEGSLPTSNGNVQMYIDDVTITASLGQILNIFPNPGFELLTATSGLNTGTVFSNISAYSSTGSTIAATTAAGTFVDGTTALAVTSSTGTTNYVPQILNSNASPLATIAGYQYKCTFKVATPTTSPAGVVSITLQDVAGVASPVYLATQATPNDGIFKTYTGYFNAPSTQTLLLFNLGAVANATYYIDAVTVEPSSAVPIKLLSFAGQRKESYVSLSWTTASEINNDYFEVERKLNNNQFVSVGKVVSKANTSGVSQNISYTFNDPTNGTGVAYYRLKQVDKDGTITYSTVVRVNLNGSKIQMSVYPNPVKNNSVLSLNTADAGTVKIIVLSPDGKMITSKLVAVEVGTNSVQLGEMVKNIAAGTYLVNAYSTKQDELIGSIKIIK